MKDELWKKILLSILGLIIITVFVYTIFEENLQEGLGDEAAIAITSAQGTIQRTIRSITANIFNFAKIMMDKAAFAFSSSQRTALAAQEAGRDAVNASQEAGRDATIAGQATLQRTTIDIRRSIMLKLSTLRITLGQKLSSVISRWNTLQGWMTLFGILGVVILVGKWIYKVLRWFVMSVVCGIQFLGKFNSCFFWYLLDIIGNIIYFISYFFFCGLWDFLIWTFGGGEDFLYNLYWKPMMDGIKAIDCYFFDLTGVHLIHFNDNIIKKCYNCNPGPFPRFPNIFSQSGIKNAIKEYGLIPPHLISL